MVGTRKRASDADASPGRAQRLAKRAKLQEKQEQAKKEREEEQRRLKEERRLEQARVEEEKRKEKEKQAKAAQRKRQKAKGKFVLEVEFSPEVSTASTLAEPSEEEKKRRAAAGMTPQWIGMLEKLKAFKALVGHCRVPRKYKDDTALGSWVRTQRQYYLQQKMSSERRAALEEVGFEFVVAPDASLSWKEAFDELKLYHEKNGNCDIPTGYDESPQLLYWTFYQREMYRKGKLTDEQKRLLESIGFGWEHRWPTARMPPKTLDEIWKMNFEKLQKFREAKGHCNVPSNFVPDLKFGKWIETQRTAFRKGRISQERIKALEGIGFEWRRTGRPFPSQTEPTPEQEAMWQKSFALLQAWHAENGNCNAPYEEDPQLNIWIRAQRNFYRRNQLTAERKKALESLGFDFTVKEAPSPIKSPQGHHNVNRFSPQELVWNKRLEELKLFREENGHSNVPGSFVGNPVLGRWVGTQRTAYRRGQMSDERIAALEELDFQWRLNDSSQVKNSAASAAAWQAMFEKLQAFRTQNSHTDVPVDYAPDPALGRWVKTQKLANRSQRISDERKQALDSVDFDWQLKDADLEPESRESGPLWETKFKRLKSFKDSEGHCNVPREYSADPALGRWVHQQRVVNRRQQMLKERFDALNSLGFDWRVPENGSVQADLNAVWAMQFEKLKVFKMATGHCNVPNTYVPDPSFARWVSTQRTVYRRNQMHEDRKDKLESLGFEWRLGPKGRTWEDNFSRLKAHKEETGTTFLSKDFEDTALRNWVINQRQKYSKGAMPQEQIQQLESIGFAWSADQEKTMLWDIQFNKLLSFKDQNGHLGIPSNFPEDPSLLEWISYQHSAYFAKKMSEERIEKLISIGFIFNNDVVDGDKKPAASGQRVSWNKYYDALLDYKERFGHTNVPGDHAEDPGLARWVYNQRKLYSKGQGPTQDRIGKLDSIGFDWTMQQRRSSLGSIDARASPGTSEMEMDAVMAAAVGMTAATLTPPRANETTRTAPATPAITWARTAASPETNTVQQGIQQMAVNLEVERAKLDAENKQLKRTNQKLETANHNLNKRLTETENAFRKETQELREKLQYYDEMLNTHAETLQNHGAQLEQIVQPVIRQGPSHGPPEGEMPSLEAQGQQLAHLAQQVQDMRQVQYTLQHQVGVQNLTYRL